MSIDSVNNKYITSKKEFTEVEIGDTKQTDFYPQVKFIHLDMEY